MLLGTLGTSPSLIAPGALAGALLMLLLPWTWQVVSERAERIRLDERAEVAARIHDSVLQTLALIQREAGDAQHVSALARRQERDLRRWLYGSGYGSSATLEGALADAAADVEGAHGVRIELASAGDAPLDEPLSQLVLAAREALTNAAKHAGIDEVAVYAEVGPAAVASSCATAAPASTAPPSPPTAAASPSRSRRAWSGRAAARSSPRRPARAPRSS